MITLNVSHIQRFCTGDGPGIRTTVFLKGCDLRCPWCHNPENIPSAPVTIKYGVSGKTVTYGRIMTADEVFSDVIEDIDFYRESGGGVTFSGGESLLQSKAVSELEKLLKAEGVSTLIDTAGSVPVRMIDDVIGDTDMFYFDYKIADPVLYKTVINGDRDVVLNNLAYLIGRGKTVHVRIPLIPGFNMSGADCEAICADLCKAGAEYADLLPFHRLGSSKYEYMGLEYAYKNVAPPDAAEIEKIRKIYERYFKTFVE